MSVSYIFTGGGTAGHVSPGLAVANSLLDEATRRNWCVEIVWIGSRTGMERRLVESAGISFLGISSGKLRRYPSFKNIIDFVKIGVGIVEAIWAVSRLRPAVVFSKGGYVSVPPVIAARIAGVPVITHESDLDPGLATKINARCAEKILVSFESTIRYFPERIHRRIAVTGNPVRPEVINGDRGKGLAVLKFRVAKPLLLVVGGSQGARALNSLVEKALPRLLEKWNIVHQTGTQSDLYRETAGYKRISYIGEGYGDILAAADAVLCRAGAATLWELAAMGKPSILVPLGLDASRGDQIRNAELFEELGASYILHIGEKDGVDELLRLTDQLVCNTEQRSTMAGRAAGIFKPDAADQIACHIADIGGGD